MTSHELRLYRRLGLPSWSCITCSLPQFSDSFFSDSLVSSACYQGPWDKACSDTYSISLIDDGQLIPDPARVFNEYFSTPVIEKSVIERTIQEFESHPSVALIRGKHDDLAFSFEHVSQ